MGAFLPHFRYIFEPPRSKGDFQDAGGKLVFNTGRSFEDYLVLKKKWDIINPDFFIGACGTQIYSCDSDGNYHEIEVWKQTLDRDWDKTGVSVSLTMTPLTCPREVVQQRVMDSERLRRCYGSIKEKRESMGNPFLFSFKIPQADFTVDQVSWRLCHGR